MSKKSSHTRGHDVAYFEDFAEFLDRGRDEGVDGVVAGGQHLGNVAADVANPESVEQAAEGAVFARFERGDEVGGGFLSHAIESGQLFGGERVQIDRTVDELAIDELIDDGGAHAVDVHGAAAGEVFQAFLELRRAGGVEAADEDAVGIFVERSATRGAGLGQCERLGASRTFLGHESDHLRDDFPGFLQFHRVANAQVLACQVLEIVQTGPFHRRSREQNGRHLSHGRQCADLPTWMVMALSLVRATCAGNLKAITQRGALEVAPRRRRCSGDSTLITMPSVS